MATITVEQFRAIPIELQRAFELTLPMPLTAIFSRRYGLLPPVKQVRGQDGVWGKVGQSRTVVTTDGGTMRELLTEVDVPHSFNYRLSEISGPMRPLVDSIDGRLGIRQVRHWDLDFLAMDLAPKTSWCRCVAPNRLDVAWLCTSGTRASVRATAHRGL
jgi:hypothetical protein